MSDETQTDAPQPPQSPQEAPEVLEGLLVTVPLSATSTQALEAIHAITQDTSTAAINKSLQLWSFVQRTQHSGGAVWVDDGEGVLTRQHFS